MITLYTIHCARCKILEMKLKQKNINFETVEDEAEVVAYGTAHGIRTAPLLDVDGECLGYEAAVKWVNER